MVMEEPPYDGAQFLPILTFFDQRDCFNKLSAHLCPQRRFQIGKTFYHLRPSANLDPNVLKQPSNNCLSTPSDETVGWGFQGDR